jgi:predicted nucleic acid-binding protein
MPSRFGIDTSILVRLLTGDPPADFERCHRALLALVEADDCEIYASNQVIGEGYIAVQHHYGVSKEDARAGLREVLQSGLIQPLEGPAVLDSLAAGKPPGLLDRLIAGSYASAGLGTLTLDRKMAALQGARLLK